MLESIDLKFTLTPTAPIIGPPNLHEIRGLSLPVVWTSLSSSTSLQTWKTSPSEIRWKSITRKPKLSLSTFQRNLTYSPNYTSLTATHLRGSTRRGSLVSPSTATSAGLPMLMTLPGGQLKSFGSWSDSRQRPAHHRLPDPCPLYPGICCSFLPWWPRQGVQKKAFAVILGNKSALSLLKLERLDTRRVNLFHSFVRQVLKTPVNVHPSTLTTGRTWGTPSHTWSTAATPPGTSAALSPTWPDCSTRGLRLTNLVPNQEQPPLPSASLPNLWQEIFFEHIYSYF
jgi:hypothetical protein